MELRKDYLLNRWVIIAEGRGKRPHEFKIESAPEKLEPCVFCPGNENQTPPESFRVEKDGTWQVRVVPNKFSAVDPKGEPNIKTHNSFYTFAGDHGEHEIIVDTPFHTKKFGELSVEEIIPILKTYSMRVKALLKDPFDKYVCIFKNQGREAGASLRHTHSQVISLAMIPPEVQDKLDAIKKYPNCPYCEIIAKEKNSFRRCFENDSCISFAPYASRFNYESVIFPKRHIKDFDDFDDSMYKDFASMLKSITQKLESIGAAYDISWYYSPMGEDLHFHVEIMPRIALWAGFEVGFGITINVVSPEEAAKFYRGES